MKKKKKKIINRLPLKDFLSESIQINSRQDLLKDIVRIQIVEQAIEKTGREVWRALMENDLENAKHLEITYTLDIGYKN